MKRQEKRTKHMKQPFKKYWLPSNKTEILERRKQTMWTVWFLQFPAWVFAVCTAVGRIQVSLADSLHQGERARVRWGHGGWWLEFLGWTEHRRVHRCMPGAMYIQRVASKDFVEKDIIIILKNSPNLPRSDRDIIRQIDQTNWY